MKHKPLKEFDPATLQAAREKVAADWEENAHAIRGCSDYGPEITEAQKDQYLQKGIGLLRGNTAGESRQQLHHLAADLR